MKASYCIGIAVVFILGSTPQTHATIVNNLECHQFVPPIVIYSFNPCRYTCIVGSREGPHKIIMQLAPDGTPCMDFPPSTTSRFQYVGHCRRGTCLYNANNGLLVPYEWEPTFEKNGSNNSNDVIMNGYHINTPVIGSAIFALSSFSAKTNSIPYEGKSQTYIGETHAASTSYERNRTRKVPQPIFRAKRSPKGHHAYNRRRRNRQGRRTRGGIRRSEQFQYRGIRSGQSGAHHTPTGTTYSYNPPLTTTYTIHPPFATTHKIHPPLTDTHTSHPPLATTHTLYPPRATTHTYHPAVHTPAVIIFNEPQKKKGRGLSKWATSALGMAAGAAAGAGTATAIGHLSRPKESHPPITTAKQHEESKITQSQNYDGKETEYKGKPAKATAVNAEENEETEKNGSNRTDGTDNVNGPNNGTIKNEESKRTDSGSTGKSGSGGDDEKIKAEGSSEKESTKAGVNTTDDVSEKSPTKQKEEHQTATAEKNDGARSEEKNSGGEDGGQKSRTKEESHSENTEGKSETNNEVGAKSAKNSVDNQPDEDHETSKKKRKRKGFFRRLFGRIF